MDYIANAFASNNDQEYTYIKIYKLLQDKINEIFGNVNLEEVNKISYKSSIKEFLRRNTIICSEMSTDILLEHLYHDLREFSFISRDDLFNQPGFEQININSYCDIYIKKSGKEQLSDYSFIDTEQSINVIKKMLRRNDLTIDDSTPRRTADIGKGIRITVMKTPLVDEDVGITCSIRKVSTDTISEEFIVNNGMLTNEMMNFLKVIVEKKVSVIISGETGSGKSSIGGILLDNFVNKGHRLFTIEEGAREWNFVKRDKNGKLKTNVIHTKTLQADKKENSITQEHLIKDSLRYDPDSIAPSEVRGEEAFEVISVANSGHGVLTTIHTNGVHSTPGKMVTYAKKAFQMDDNTLLDMVTTAFPILVHCELFPDGKRRVKEIAEVIGHQNNKPIISMLYEWETEDTEFDGETIIQMLGKFKHKNIISDKLQKFLLDKAVTKAFLTEFTQIQKEG